MDEQELLKFQRPARYLGKEWNLHFKKPSLKDLRVCLCFPEIYEVGMSNLGFRIVYEIFSESEGVSCERAFMPFGDLEEYLIKEKKYLFSLETKTPLKDFDILAFSFSYELNFINFLKMLKLGGVEIEREKRQSPLVVMGGIINPEFLSGFVDVFYLGEFEGASYRFIETLKKSKNYSKEEKLLSLASIPGVYIPQFYSLDEQGFLKPLEKSASFPLQWQYYRGFRDEVFPKNWIVSYLPLVFDRLQFEIQRGCPNRCKFCQARFIYFPYRERNPDFIKDNLIRIYEKTGYEEISLSGLSVIDYSQIEELLKEIIPYFKNKKVGIFLPSLRPNGKASRVLRLLNFAKKPGLTLALETGSDRLREAIGKHIDIDDAKEIIRVASHRGYKLFKFYFMIGLPGESREDVLEIHSLLEELSLVYKKERGFYPQMNVTVSYFIPKSFSEFEKERMLSLEELKERKTLLQKSFSKSRFLKLKFSDYNVSFLECLLSRANRKITPLIKEVFLRVIDERVNYLKLEVWEDLSKRLNLDLEYFLEEPAPLKLLGRDGGKVCPKDII